MLRVYISERSKEMFNGLNEKGMKKFIAVLLVAVFAAGAWMQTYAAPKNKVNTRAVINLVGQYENEDGFEIMSVGSLGLAIFKAIVKFSDENDDAKELMQIVNHLNKVVIVEYDGADSARKDAFSRKLEGIMGDTEKILEVKDDGDAINIYGTYADEGDTIDDIVVHIPGDCTMICLFGSISAEKIAEIVKMSNE